MIVFVGWLPSNTRCRDLVRGHAFGLHLFTRLAERERLGLREQVRGEQVLVVADDLVGLREPDEVARDQLRALVDQLVVGVLPVRARLAPDDRAGLPLDPVAVAVDRLPVALHLQLLEVRRQVGEVLAVRQDRDGLGAEEIVVPDADQPQEHRQVLLDRRGPEVLVHRVEAGEHLAERVGADRDHQRQPDRRVERVATADPVPELEHVRGVDAELRDLLRVRRHRDEVLRDRGVVAELRERPLARGRALVIVSSVVNVFDAMMNSVSSGSRSRVAS